MQLYSNTNVYEVTFIHVFIQHETKILQNKKVTTSFLHGLCYFIVYVSNEQEMLQYASTDFFFFLYRVIPRAQNETKVIPVTQYKIKHIQI